MLLVSICSVVIGFLTWIGQNGISEWFDAVSDLYLVLTQILLLWFILGYCDTTREISTRRTESFIGFEVNDSFVQPLSTEASDQMPDTNYFELDDAIKGISDGLQKKKKVHGYEYS